MPRDFSHEHNALRNKLSETLCDYPPIEIQDNDIIKVFSKINTQKAPGPDKIGTLLLKKCIHGLLPIIHFIFQLSAAIYHLPTIWKTGEIIPVSKKPIAKVSNDLRPVTLTPILSKFIKRIMF